VKAARRWNWEAALVPCWGWLRSVPIARFLSLLFPFAVLALLDRERTLSWSDVIMAGAAVSAGYGVIYGLAGDWLHRRARRTRNANDALTLSDLLVYLVGCGLLLLVGLMVVIGALSPASLKAYTGAMESELMRVHAFQQAYFARDGRYPSSLDSLSVNPYTSVRVTLLRADSASWAAEAAYDGQKFRCRLAVDRRPGMLPDSLNGVPVCDPLPGLKR
jgi:hypothetical protein